MSTSAEKAGYAVSIATGDALDVRELTVHERMSALFSIQLTVVSENADVDFEAAIGQPAAFQVRGGVAEAAPRNWTGICRELQQISVEETGLSTYSLEIVPALWMATQRRNHRMFQLMSDVDIALQILGEWGVEPSQQLSGTYKKRKYRVQYGESDYAFFCRMLEDAGVSFYFVDQGGQSTLVLSDAPQGNPLRDPRITFRDHPNNADLEHVTEVRVRRQIRPGRFTLRDHDYRRPPSYRLLGAATLGAGIEDQLEQFHYLPGAFLFESDRGDPTPQADDRGRYRTDEAEAQAMAQRELDASRSEVLTCTFATNAIDLAPGVVFSMRRHPRQDLGEDRRLLVVATTMRGDTAARTLEHRGEARSADVPYRPVHATPKPKVIGVESATVVGPAGEEIHTDEFGRVRVHFHWDRESRMDEKSSCWVHVSQPWGGAGYGGVNLPRIGQEVLVDFLGGDPDRPIILGRVYTNLQKQPYVLPDNKTQSGWKSNSTTGTGGYNELMFEDAAGKELVRIQAEKDLNMLVKHDEQDTVGHDRTRLVQNNESVTVGKNRTKQVVQNERMTIGQNQSITVGVNRSAQIGTNDTTTVGTRHLVMITPPGEAGPSTSSSITMTDKKIVLDTGAGATITLDHDKITIEADDLVEIFGKKRGVNVHASGPSGKTNFFTGDSFVVACKTVTIAGNTVGIAAVGENNISGGLVQINGPGLPAGRVTDLAPATITIGSSTVFIGGAPTPREITRDPKTGELCYGKGIKIGGDAAYQAKALAAVCRLDSTPTMHAAIDDLEKSGHTETLLPYNNPKDPFNATTTATNGAGAIQKGVGSDSVINWNPDVNGFGPPGTTPDSEQPGSDIILAHEMIHGTHDATGTAGNGPVNGDGVNVPEERNTVGLPARTYNNPNNPSDPLNGTALPDTTGGPYTENKVRQDYANQGRLSPVTGQPPVQRPSYYDPNPDGSPGAPL